MKTTLIFLVSLAVILGIFTFFAVFESSSGNYAVNPLPMTSNATTTMFVMPSSTASSTPDQGSSAAGFYGTAFTTPPLTWNDGGATFGVTSVALQGNQLSFTLTIQLGASPACVPLDLRLVADEAGTLQGPTTPAFSFPDTGSCNGAPNEVYNNQTITFNVDPTNLPLLFTTGGSANIFFEIATSTANGLQIVFPGTSG